MLLEARRKEAASGHCTYVFRMTLRTQDFLGLLGWTENALLEAFCTTSTVDCGADDTRCCSNSEM